MPKGKYIYEKDKKNFGIKKFMVFFMG